MTAPIQALAAHGAGQPLQLFTYILGPLGSEEVEIAVESCGICHSDLSMLDNEWGMTTYPFVPGHEVIGRVIAHGEHTKRLSIGDRVGLGWAGFQAVAVPAINASPATRTFAPRHFATRVRADWTWLAPLPAGLDEKKPAPCSAAASAGWVTWP